MRKNPRRILSPQRLPFRHPGTGDTNLTKPCTGCKKSDGLPQKSKSVNYFTSMTAKLPNVTMKAWIAENGSLQNDKKAKPVNRAYAILDKRDISKSLRKKLSP